MAHGTESRRSGRVQLPRGPLNTRVPSAWKPICNVFSDDGKAVARTVRVHVSRGPSLSDDLANIRFSAGVWWTLGASVPWLGGAQQECGALRFRYGSQGVSRTLICDLASGDYQVPSCEHLYVDAVRYTPGTDGESMPSDFAAESEVQAEITDGGAADYSPMVLTAPSSLSLEADSVASCAVPRGAYAFDLFPDSPIATANTFEVGPPGALRDFLNGVQMPGGPLPVLSNVITVQARGASPVAARLVFFVR